MEATTEPLTARQLQIVRGLDHGKTQARIAAELGVSPNAVKGHLRRIERKLEVHRAREIPHAAREKGLL